LCCSLEASRAPRLRSKPTSKIVRSSVWNLVFEPICPSLSLPFSLFLFLSSCSLLRHSLVLSFTLHADFTVGFTVTEKVDINGPKMCSLYRFVKLAFPGLVRWNFSSKFLVNQSGERESVCVCCVLCVVSLLNLPSPSTPPPRCRQGGQAITAVGRRAGAGHCRTAEHRPEAAGMTAESRARSHACALL
jgi:hypothetical protein